MTHPLLDLLGLVAEQASTLGNSEVINCIEVNLTSVSNPSYQANVKFQDRTLAWGTYVSADPVEALTTAIDIALRGEEVRRAESTAHHHEKRELATQFMEGLQTEYGDNIAAAKVELVPYKGWVVVIFPRTGYTFTDLEGLVEIREMPAGTRLTKTPTTSSKPSSAPAPTKPIGPAPEGGRASLTKDKLEAEYKAIYGKGPDRNIKKLDLAAMLDDLEAKASAKADVDQVLEQAAATEVAGETDEDLL